MAPDPKEAAMPHKPLTDREARLARLRARRGTPEWQADGAALVAARQARYLAERQAADHARRQQLADWLENQADRVAPDRLAAALAAVGQAVADAEADYPDVAADDVAHDMALNWAKGLPASRANLATAHAVLRALLGYTPADTLRALGGEL